VNTLKQYLITDPHFYSNDCEKFEASLSKVLTTHSVEYACFRDKESNNIQELAQIFIKVCKKFDIPNIYINTHLSLAKEFSFHGIHLNSAQLGQVKEAKELGLKTVFSCHSHEEVQNAIDENIDMVTYSPIFFTPNKGQEKGIDELQNTLRKFDIPIIALGGIITKEHLELLAQTDAKYFASIRYFL